MVLEMGEGGAERAGGARGSAIVQLRATLADVRHFAAHRAAHDRGEDGRSRFRASISRRSFRWAQGRIPLIVKVDRASDIREVIALAREEKLRIILDGAEEGWRAADAISAAKVPVILDPLADLPRSFSELGATMENAARLHAAGVTIVIKTGSGVAHRARELRYGAGNAVAWGLPHDAAVAAITINPARVFGVADRIGTLETGRAADLVLWNGDPLEPLSQPQALFVEGPKSRLRPAPGIARPLYAPPRPDRYRAAVSRRYRPVRASEAFAERADPLAPNRPRRRSSLDPHADARRSQRRCARGGGADDASSADSASSGAVLATSVAR